jgi:hypothetical protein
MSEKSFHLAVRVGIAKGKERSLLLLRSPTDHDFDDQCGMSGGEINSTMTLDLDKRGFGYGRASKARSEDHGYDFSNCCCV